MSKSVYKKSDLRKLYLLRWISILALGVIASFIIHFIFQLQAAHDFSNYITTGGIRSIAIVSAIQGWLIYVICRKFHVKTLTKQPLLDYLEQLKYPSISWLFIFIPLIYIINTGYSNFIDAFVHTSGGLNLSIILFSFSCFSWVNENPISSRQKKTKAQVTVDDLLSDDDMFESWLIDKAPSEVDLLNRDGYVNRIANRIQQKEGGTNEHGRSQVLLGEYGSGKSTIIKLVVEKVDDTKKGQWIPSAFSSWGRGDQSHSLIYLLLEQIISDLGKEIEVTSLISLPKNYLAAAYNIHPWFHVLSILNSSQRPEEVLESIDRLLEVNDKKLLIVLEDIDRANGAEGVVNDFCGFFDRLKELRHVKFIITIGYGNSNNQVFNTLPRIVDAREDLSEANVDLILNRFFKFCMKHQCTNGKYIFGEEEPYDTWSLSDRIGQHSFRYQKDLYDELLSILSNPRVLKLVLKRTYESWTVLAGEVNFNDLLLFNAYRHTKSNFNEVVDSSVQRSETEPASSKIHKYLSGENQSSDDLQGFKELRYKNIMKNECLNGILVSDTILFDLIIRAINNKENSYSELSNLIYSSYDVADRFLRMLRYVGEFYVGDERLYHKFIISLASSIIEKPDSQIASYHWIISRSIRYFGQYYNVKFDDEFFKKLFEIGFYISFISFIKNIRLIVSQELISKDLMVVSKPIFSEKFLRFLDENGKEVNFDNYFLGDLSALRVNEFCKEMFLTPLLSSNNISSDNTLIIISLVVNEVITGKQNDMLFNDKEYRNITSSDYADAINEIVDSNIRSEVFDKISKLDDMDLSQSIHWDKIQPVLSAIR